jgi:hypothetical protein
MKSHRVESIHHEVSDLENKVIDHELPQLGSEDGTSWWQSHRASSS